MRRTLFVIALAACGSSPPKVEPVTGPEQTEAVKLPDHDPKPADPKPDPGPTGPPAQDAFLVECRGFIAQAKQQHQAIAATADKRTIANTLDVFNEVTRYARNASSIASLYAEVHPDPKVRDAARECEREISSYSTELWLDRKVYDAIQAVDVKAADATTKRFAAHVLREYKRTGALLDDAKRARIKVIDDSITEVGQEISRTIAEDTRFVEVRDKARLAGLPADYIAAHPPDAGGVVKITTDNPDYIPFMSYATDDELRKQLYVKYRSRGDTTNEAAIAKLLVLRAERAKMLGFKDWADFQSDDKMLRGGANAVKFIERITALAKPRAKQDYDELLAQLKKVDPKATTVTEWQRPWLEVALKKDKYSVDAAVVRAYFPYDKVLAGLLDITGKIYDVEYKPAADAKPWHADVKSFDVMRKGEKLGRIHLDMHPRPDKYKHAAQFTLKDGVTGKQLPEGVLVCNFPAGAALMEHADVVTMFHEFGHLMHHTFGGHQRWTLQAGVATEHDFVEAPSMMFEEWGWSHETLSRFAKHHKTGEVIPQELVAKMQKARRFGIGAWTAQQMLYAALSLQFHQADPKKLDQLGTLKRLQAKHVPFAYVEGTRFHTSFGHLVGYSSMYYTYMWSLVIAKDLLSPFEKTGLMDTAVTYKYRDKILAAGGTKDAADLVADFLGRKYDFKAFEKYVSGQ